MDSGTRRAFPLDSRTVWIEQQIVHQVLLPKDNLAVGPAEYSPKILERHITTPVLGKFRGPADHFRGFKSTNSLRSNSPQSRRSVSPKVREERSEYSTIFHDHDIRQPLDPKLRFCPTPGPYLSQDPALTSTSVYGVSEVHNTSDFGHHDIPFGDRMKYKTALPDYNVNYDSLQVKKAPILTTIPKSKRIHIPKKGDPPCPLESDHRERPRSSSPKRSQSPPYRPNKSMGEMSVLEWRCSLVKLPKLKTREPPKIHFMTQSYKREKKKMPVMLTPKVVKERARVNLFEHILAIPRSHRSTAYK
jgi:hypothetical protein